MIETREHPKKKIEVLGKQMAYVEMGEGDPIVFLHGNPTSSYLWRNIMPYAKDLGRCIAPDLIGMGDSDKLDDTGPGSYTYLDHRRYLNAALDALGVTDNVTLVLHDWGSALGFDWANRHREAVKGICYMEALVRRPVWDDVPEGWMDTVLGYRSAAGEDMVLKDNTFVEALLPGSIMRDLKDVEMDVYRRPFLNAGEDRRPMLSWIRQVPFDGEPIELAGIMQAYGEWLSTDETLAKLLIRVEPGAIMPGASREFCRAWPNQTEVTVEGLHFPQEDCPDEIGAALRAWMIR